MSLPIRSPRICALFLFFSMALNAQDADPGIKNPSKFDPKRPLAAELKTNVPDGFKLVAVGDCIISRPLLPYIGRDPDFARAVEVLKSGDATYGNLETSILDMRTFKGFPYTGPDDMPLVAEPGVAKDLAAMGFDVMSRANNHALDWGIEGMRETTRWADEAGLVTAGVGENQGMARRAQYYEGAKARVGIVSMAATFRPGSEALPDHDGVPGRPGVNALVVKKTVIVTTEAMRDLTALRQKLYPEVKFEKSADTLTLFDTKFKSGPKRGLTYEMDSVDLAGILRNVRLGKQQSDFLLVTIHSHEPADTAGPELKNDFLDTPADFLSTLAKAAIDAGADAFLTTGIHHLGPIEIYKGRPIFYGLGNFFWSDIQEPLPADVYAQYRDSLDAFAHPERATDADFVNVLNAEGFAGDAPFEAILTETRFDHGQVSEIRLYPIDLGYGKKLTQSGIPRTASLEQAMKILKRVHDISAPYGTQIAIESSPDWHYVGVIRPGGK